MGWVLIGFALIAAIDLIPLIRRRNTRGIIGFSIFFVLALTLALLHVKDVQMPSVMMFLHDVFKSIGLNY